MPWGRLDDSLYDHPKLDRLPLARRLEAVGLWARSISWCNRFLTDGHIPRSRIAKLDGNAELADLLVAAGLYDESPAGYIVHDFLEFNDSRVHVEERRAKDADRKKKWRETRHGGTSSVDDGDVPRGVPSSVRAESRVESQVESQVESRDSRGRSARESRPDPTRPDPTRPTESLERGSSRATTKAERADIAALHARGWKRVTKAQRKVLDEILSRHNRTGPAFAAEAIRMAPADVDPLEAAMAADKVWQQAERRRADAEEAAWAETKATERADAERIAADAPDWLKAPVEVGS